jgi:hypothetical protein
LYVSVLPRFQVLRCFRSFKFRRVYVVRHAGFVLTRYWRTLNIGLLKVLRLYRRTERTRKLKRNFFLNTLALYNAGRIMQRLARGAVARLRARRKARVVNEAAKKLQRLVRARWDRRAYFRERVACALASVEGAPQFGFCRAPKHHHKPPWSETAQLLRVQQVPTQPEGSPPRYTFDGTRKYSSSLFATGTGFRCDMDVQRAFNAGLRDTRPATPPPKGNVSPSMLSPEEKARAEHRKQPLGMPARLRSFYE